MRLTTSNSQQMLHKACFYHAVEWLSQQRKGLTTGCSHTHIRCTHHKLRHTCLHHSLRSQAAQHQAHEPTVVTHHAVKQRHLQPQGSISHGSRPLIAGRTHQLSIQPSSPMLVCSAGSLTLNVSQCETSLPPCTSSTCISCNRAQHMPLGMVGTGSVGWRRTRKMTEKKHM